MNEGWHGDDYLILFDESEIASASDRYAIAQSLPGFEVLGLRSWDDFIVRDPLGHTYSVPTVPANAQHLSPFSIPKDAPRLRSDERFRGKIKWYVKPIVFGGDPNLGGNVAWVTHETHAQAVRWWNELYRSLKAQPGPEAPT